MPVGFQVGHGIPPVPDLGIQRQWTQVGPHPERPEPPQFRFLPKVVLCPLKREMFRMEDWL